MINYKRVPPPCDYSKFQSYSRLALKRVAQSYKLTKSAIDLLICIHTLQREGIFPISYEILKSRCPYADGTIYKGLHSLTKLGLIQKLGVKYCTLRRGDYLVRNFNTELSRMVRDTDLSHWKKIKVKT